MSASLRSADPFDVSQPIRCPVQTRSRPPPSLSLSLRPVRLWHAVGLRFQPSQLISFHLSPKLNTRRAPESQWPEINGFAQITWHTRLGEKLRVSLPPPVHLSLLPLFVQLSLSHSSTPPLLPDSSSSSSSSFLTLKSRMGLEETRLELDG